MLKKINTPARAKKFTHSPLTLATYECQVASNEGWSITSESVGGPRSISRSGPKSPLTTDFSAWDFVIKMALSGSKLHRQALLISATESPDQYRLYVQDAIVLPCPDSNEKPWLVKFPAGKVERFEFKIDAHLTASNYRRTVSYNTIA